jgi:hypothetical protein
LWRRSHVVGRPALVTVTSAALLVAVAVGLPSHLGSSAVSAAEHDHARTAALRAAYAPNIALRAFNNSLGDAATTDAGPLWDEVVPAILGTVPQGVSILTMDLVDRGPFISVTATASATSDALVPRWLEALRVHHIGASTSGVTVDASGAANFTTTFTVPRSFR